MIIIFDTDFFKLVHCRYLDSVTNKDSTLPPIPHLHSLLTDNGEPHPEVDIFKLVRSSYEVINLDHEACFEVWFWFSECTPKI